ncbi:MULTISPECIES: hypothetical protein [unclassified Pseudoalteromonas]|uniref:hypothetical protein n=1 Tax=unclassified Pseudoalteromonas TaxID=194690 RepID=UPI001F46582A|nr:MULTISPECIES: hypothetical protein [unclassified Pseudoalteromonas]MCF2828326.1 hypothetical protein [Pseudoalteromonas sp. OF5H-5]MCF2832164.1 hypothetical protein [Pseudoalteromonas sp. DL2-H6]MCF2924414.1 hypothetical protein [Pseudoalteromonas sp. DL2-H1]
MNAWMRALPQCCVFGGRSEFTSRDFLYPKQQKTHRIATTGFDVHGFLPELHYNPSAGKPPLSMLHCADTVVGASLPREIFYT